LYYPNRKILSPRLDFARYATKIQAAPV